MCPSIGGPFGRFEMRECMMLAWEVLKVETAWRWNGGQSDVLSPDWPMRSPDA